MNDTERVVSTWAARHQECFYISGGRLEACLTEDELVEFAEFVLTADLDRRRAIADAGRALLRSNGGDREWEALRVALYELDGDGDE